MHCVDNNCASTVESVFVSAVKRHGLPPRIHSDMGGENVDVWRYMISEHSTTFCDMFWCVSTLYYDTFMQLQAEGKLDPLNEVDLFCLRFVFKPLINSALESWVETWNNDSVSTERSQTPNQLFIQGAIEQNRMPVIPPSARRNLNPSPSPRDHVRVPRLLFKPCRALQQQLAVVDPLGPTTDLAVIY